jgi:hypothetical protein
LNDTDKITNAIGDEFLYMLALIGSRPQIHSKAGVQEVINSLPGSSAGKAKQLYKKTKQNGPAQGVAAKQAMSNDNTIRL